MTDNNQSSDCGCKKPSRTNDAPAQPLSRRNLLLKVGAGLNGIAAALIGVPPIGLCIVDFHTEVGNQLDFAGIFGPISRR